MRPTPTLFWLNKHLGSGIKERWKQAINRTRTPKLGRHTKHGGFVVDYNEVRSYVVPDLKNFKLTPFVTKRAKPMPLSEGAGTAKPNGQTYLERWKRENAED